MPNFAKMLAESEKARQERIYIETHPFSPEGIRAFKAERRKRVAEIFLKMMRENQ